MATKEAWRDHSRLLSIFSGLDNCLANFKIFYEELTVFKAEVLDDPARKVELKKLIDEDEDLTLTSIQNRINGFKAIYNYLIGG